MQKLAASFFKETIRILMYAYYLRLSHNTTFMVWAHSSSMPTGIIPLEAGTWSNVKQAMKVIAKPFSIFLIHYPRTYVIVNQTGFCIRLYTKHTLEQT